MESGYDESRNVVYAHEVVDREKTYLAWDAHWVLVQYELAKPRLLGVPHQSTPPSRGKDTQSVSTAR